MTKKLPAPTALATKFPHLDRVCRLHEAAKQAARMAVVYAAAAGHELNQAKAELGHGGFGDFCKQLPFGHSTRAKYMDLADKFQERLDEMGEIDISDMLALADSTQLTARTTKLLSHVEEATGGASLTQLYFDWGIVRPTTKPIRATPHAADPHSKVELKKMTAEERWSEVGNTILKYGIEKPDWHRLDEGRIEALHAVVTRFQKALEKAVAK